MAPELSRIEAIRSFVTPTIVVVGFGHKRADAEQGVEATLRERLARFGLSLHQEQDPPRGVWPVRGFERGARRMEGSEQAQRLSRFWELTHWIADQP